MATIKGKWKWNETFVNDKLDQVATEITTSINFSSNNENYTSLTLYTSAVNLDPVGIRYNDTEVRDLTEHTEDENNYYTTAYFVEEYRIMDFGDIEQQIDDKLYAFIAVNATELVSKITFNSDVAIKGDLTVMGDTISESHQDLLIKDATIVANADNDPLTVSSVGTVYRTGPEGKDYGIIYNTSKNSVQLGEGTYDENGFTFDTDENGESLGKSLVTREFDETLTERAIPYWDSEALSLKESALVVDQSSADATSVRMQYSDTGDYNFYLTSSRLVFNGLNGYGASIPEIRVGEGEIRIGEAKLTEAILLQLLALLQNPTITNNNNLTGEV